MPIKSSQVEHTPRPAPAADCLARGSLEEDEADNCDKNPISPKLGAPSPLGKRRLWSQRRRCRGHQDLPTGSHEEASWLSQRVTADGWRAGFEGPARRFGGPAGAG